MIDLVFTTCSLVSKSTGLGTDCMINVVHNKQLPLCTTSTPKGTRSTLLCRPPEQLCTPNLHFTLDMQVRTLCTHLIVSNIILLSDYRISQKFPSLRCSLRPPDRLCQCSWCWIQPTTHHYWYHSSLVISTLMGFQTSLPSLPQPATDHETIHPKSPCRSYVRRAYLDAM